MASTSDIKNGLCIEYNRNLYFVIEFQHVKPGKGPAFVRTKLKNVKTGKVIDNTFPSGHKIITARVEKRSHQFLYKDIFPIRVLFFRVIVAKCTSIYKNIQSRFYRIFLKDLM